jgi:hypothetical protein
MGMLGGDLIHALYLTLFDYQECVYNLTLTHSKQIGPQTVIQFHIISLGTLLNVR